MTSVLITGITGFVGSHLVDYLVTHQPDVKISGIARWRSPLNNIEHALDKIELKQGDLLDYPSVRDAVRDSCPDIIFHLAAQSYVPYGTVAPVSTLTANATGTLNLLEVVKELKIDPIVHICSSSEVYGQVNEDEVPITEKCPLRPCSLYAVSKVTEDRLAYQYWRSFGIKTIITRMFTHTGPRRGYVFAVSNFARQIAMMELGKIPAIVKVGNLDSVRTFLDVRDAVNAYWMMIGKCDYGEPYNIGGVEVMTIREMLHRLIGMSTLKNIKVDIDNTRLRPSDVTLQIPDTTKFRAATGWKQEIPFSKTLEDTLNYWRQIESN